MKKNLLRSGFICFKRYKTLTYKTLRYEKIFLFTHRNSRKIIFLI